MPFLLGAPLPVIPKFFDPSLLSLTGWWRAGDYDESAGSWAPTASAGTSGSSNHALRYDVGGDKPTDGPTYNGRKSVLSDKTISTERGLYTDDGLGNIIHTTSYMVAFALRIYSATSSDGSAWKNTLIFGSSGSSIYWGCYVKSGGTIVLYQEGVTAATLELTVPLNTDVFIYISYDGTTATIDAGPYGSVSGAMPTIADFGARSFSIAYSQLANFINTAPIFDGRFIEGFTAFTAVATRAQLLSYVNQRNALSMG